MKCLSQNSEGSFRRTKQARDFDPYKIFDELIPYINKQIRNLNVELTIRNLPTMPEDYLGRYPDR